MESKRYYLAYGSNLNVPQMRLRCPNAIAIGTAKIPDYRLLFRCGYLTIEPQTGAEVPVAVWELTPDDEARLDVYEGFPNLYRKESMRVNVKPLSRSAAEKIGGAAAERGAELPETVGAFVYIIGEWRAARLPDGVYYQGVRDGYRTFGFSRKYLSAAIDATQDESYRLWRKATEQRQHLEEES